MIKYAEKADGAIKQGSIKVVNLSNRKEVFCERSTDKTIANKLEMNY